MHWPSAKVRETFINYFIRHSKYPHVNIPSSSIIPQNDPSLAFVNAGMNQFKDVILGLGRPPSPRVTNSQKCLRINDLSLVGADTYHHTFFEMLGNWSFANYFKAEACTMAWDLLTNVYGLDPKRLYVTYYAGGNSLPVDTETKQIWESMGIPKDRVLPYGAENFWAMGPLGPCGPSTEIHYDHRGTQTDPSEVNGDSGKVVEVWNLVFMQYNRMENGQLERLPLSHVVDTGAGLERLTAVLNGKISNYDTDLFIPIFTTIQKLAQIPFYSGKFTHGPESELDRGYRIFADHIRAATIALADGILPQTNHKIRKLIQRSLSVTTKHFLPSVNSPKDVSAFLLESVQDVSSSLSKSYPEANAVQGEIAEIIKFEVNRYFDSSNDTGVEKSIIPRLLAMDFPSLGRIKKDDIEKVKASGVVDGITALKWYESHGVTEEAGEELCEFLGIKFDKADFQQETAKTKKMHQVEIAKQMTSNSQTNFIKKLESLLSSYDPSTSGGVCDPGVFISEKTPISIEWIFNNEGEVVEKVDPTKGPYWFILNKTPFMPGGNRMDSDVGFIVLENGCKVDVDKVDALPSGWILHRVSNIPEKDFDPKSNLAFFDIDNARRFGREISAQAIYALQRWLYKKYGVIRFGEDFVSDNGLQLEVTLLKGEIDVNDIQKIQEDLNSYGIPLVTTKRIWRKNGVYELHCVTGVSAEIAMRHGSEVAFTLLQLKELYSNPESDYQSIREEVISLCQSVKQVLKDPELNFPYEVTLKAQGVLDDAEKFIEKNEELYEIESMTESLSQVKEPYVIKCFHSDLEFNSLKKITRAAEEKPVLVLVASSDGFVQGRCSILEEFATDNFSATEWMKSVTKELGIGSVSAPKGQDPKLIANLKRVRVPESTQRIQRGIEKALEYVNKARTTRLSQSQCQKMSSRVGKA